MLNPYYKSATWCFFGKVFPNPDEPEPSKKEMHAKPLVRGLQFDTVSITAKKAGLGCNSRSNKSGYAVLPRTGQLLRHEMPS